MTRNANANRNTVSVFAALAGLCAASVVARTVEHNGQTLDLHFRKLTAGEAESIWYSILTKEGDVDHTKREGHNMRQVAASMCNADGTACITADEVAALEPALMQKLLKIAVEVNDVGNEVEAVSEAASSSGTTSQAG